MIRIQAFLLVSVSVRLTQLGVNVISAKMASTISKRVTRLVVFHVGVC